MPFKLWTPSSYQCSLISFPTSCTSSKSVQPLFTAAPVTFPVPLPLPPSVTRQPAPPRPHPLVPGTGVFLPPGSIQLESAQLSVGDINATMKASGQSESTSWYGTTENGANVKSGRESREVLASSTEIFVTD